MGRCKLCDRRLLWGRGVCSHCEGPLRSEVANREEHIKRALVRLRYGSDGAATDDLCQVITDHATALARFEAKGIRTTNPAPSDLLRTATAHRRRLTFREPENLTPPRAPQRGGADVDAALRPGAERRTSPRERMEFHVRLDPGGRRAIARDLSAVGIRLETSRGKPPQGAVALTLFTSEGTLHARGTVQWTRGNPATHEQEVHLGVRFTNPDARVLALGDRG